MICIISIVARGYNKLLAFIIQNYYNNKAVKTRVYIYYVVIPTTLVKQPQFAGDVSDYLWTGYG